MKEDPGYRQLLGNILPKADVLEAAKKAAEIEVPQFRPAALENHERWLQQLNAQQAEASAALEKAMEEKAREDELDKAKKAKYDRSMLIFTASAAFLGLAALIVGIIALVTQ